MPTPDDDRLSALCDEMNALLAAKEECFRRELLPSGSITVEGVAFSFEPATIPKRGGSVRLPCLLWDGRRIATQTRANRILAALAVDALYTTLTHLRGQVEADLLRAIDALKPNP